MSKEAMRRIAGNGWAGVKRGGMIAHQVEKKTTGGGGGGRKPKETFVIRFDAARQICAEIEAAPLDAKGTTLLTRTATSMARAKASETLLPKDFHVSLDALETLFDRPGCRIK